MGPAVVGYPVQKGGTIAKENGYRPIEWDMELLKGVPPLYRALCRIILSVLFPLNKRVS